MKKTIINKSVPAIVCAWTDEYFHKSAFDVPIKYPNKKIIHFLSQFKKSHKIKLYRGINRFNKDNQQITSWTHNLNIARRYIKGLNGKVVANEFLSSQVILDTTVLTEKQKTQLGYDYHIDDKEVLVIN